MNRRPPTLKERLTPCEVCGHPLSQRHHIPHVSEVGPHESTVQLCANCHELYHLAFNAHFRDGKRAARVWGEVSQRLGLNSDLVHDIYRLAARAHEIEIDMSQAAIRAIDEADDD